MEQRTHAWIAVRAVAFLEDASSHPKLVELLKPCARHAAIGAWIPDLADIKRGGANTQHHVLKMMPYRGANPQRFVADKDELLRRLVCSSAAKNYLLQDRTLDARWWSTPYKADPSPGQHIANRAMGLGSVLKDLLLLGSPEIDDLVPGSVRFIDKVDADARTTREEAALYFFMLSHFIADACMPCHCDGRPLAGYDEGLHKQLEAHWRKGVAPDFDETRLSETRATAKAIDDLLAEARSVDGELAIDLARSQIPELPSGRDVWLETVDACRASFALSAIIAPPSRYPYGDQEARAPFETVLGPGHESLLADVDRVVLTDAVANTATIWSHLWDKVAKVE